MERFCLNCQNKGKELQHIAEMTERVKRFFTWKSILGQEIIITCLPWSRQELKKDLQASYRWYSFFVCVSLALLFLPVKQYFKWFSNRSSEIKRLPDKIWGLGYYRILLLLIKQSIKHRNSGGMEADWTWY